MNEGQAQEGAYTAYHLQARPDLVSVVGICTTGCTFTLLFSNTCQVHHTKPVEWNSEEGRRLLYAWIWRLYNPEVDSSIQLHNRADNKNAHIYHHNQWVS